MSIALVCEKTESANPVFPTAYHNAEKGKDYINLKGY